MALQVYPLSAALGGRRSEGVVYVSNIRRDGKPIGVLPDGEMQFHSDQAYRPRSMQHRCADCGASR